jgi:hypothetical protein
VVPQHLPAGDPGRGEGHEIAPAAAKKKIRRKRRKRRRGLPQRHRGAEGEKKKKRKAEDEAENEDEDDGCRQTHAAFYLMPSSRSRGAEKKSTRPERMNADER